MADVVDIFTKQKDNTPSVKTAILDSFKDIPDTLDAGIVVLKNKSGEVMVGFFNTSFEDEAVMKEVLALDVFNRQRIREGN